VPRSPQILRESWVALAGLSAVSLHTVLRRRANGESVEQIQPDLIIPTGKRKGQNPSVASIYRALAEHAKRDACPEALKQAHADFAALRSGEVPGPRPAQLHPECRAAHDRTRPARFDRRTAVGDQCPFGPGNTFVNGTPARQAQRRRRVTVSPGSFDTALNVGG
jgi:hypothetical protein